MVKVHTTAAFQNAVLMAIQSIKKICKETSAKVDRFQQALPDSVLHFQQLRTEHEVEDLARLTMDEFALIVGSTK